MRLTWLAEAEASGGYKQLALASLLQGPEGGNANPCPICGVVLRGADTLARAVWGLE
jgi:hypothetical protein